MVHACLLWHYSRVTVSTDRQLRGVVNSEYCCAILLDVCESGRRSSALIEKVHHSVCRVGEGEEIPAAARSRSMANLMHERYLHTQRSFDLCTSR